MSPYYGVDVEEAKWLMERAGDVVGGFQNGSGGSGFQSNGTNNVFFNQFKLAAARSVRTSTIVLATFNTIVAFATAMGILYDCYSRSRRNNRRFMTGQPASSFVPTEEVYPLILSLGITIQGITFAVAQSTGLNSIFTFGCTIVSQLMLPALFLVPYIQLVFSIELALRGLRKEPFAPRGKWTVSICLACIGLLTLTNFLVADFIRTNDFCFSSLFWFVSKYATGCFAILVGVSSVLLMCIAVVATKLYKNGKIEFIERVSASRMVYYMALAFVSNSFMIPFFFALTFSTRPTWKFSPQATQLSMVASVAASVSGLMTGGLYLFLKSNTLSTIGPRDKTAELEGDSPKPGLHRSSTDTSDLSFTRHLAQPVSGPGSMRRMSGDSNMNMIANRDYPGVEAHKNTLPNPLRSNPSVDLPRSPDPVQMASVDARHLRKQSYSLFPNGNPGLNQQLSATLLPSTTYTPTTTARATKDAQSALDHLKPPPSLFGRHNRDLSTISSATVQIGLRLSNVDGITSIPITNHPNNSVTSLGCPNATKSNSNRPSPVTAAPTLSPSPSPWPPALRLDTSSATIPDATPRRDPVKSARMKTLPPVPIPGLSIPMSEEEDDDDDDDSSDYEYGTNEGEGETLSPTVYDAQSPTKSRTTESVKDFLPASKFNPNASPRSPPRRSPVVKTSQTKADWI